MAVSMTLLVTAYRYAHFLLSRSSFKAIITDGIAYYK